MSSSHFDVLIIGSGQSGNPLAQAFANAGKKTGMIERASLGGTCVNVGCTPTKTIIASGRAAHMARRAGEYGVKTGQLDIDWEKVRDRKREIVKQWNSGSVKALQTVGVEVVMGDASFVGQRSLKVKLREGGERTVTADTVFLNVGERPARPDIPGLNTIDQKRVLDSTSIMELDAEPSHLVILGGGYIGCEFGQLIRRLGGCTTIVQRAKQLLPREDPDIAECVRDIFDHDDINVHLSTNVEAISKYAHPQLPIEVKIKKEDGEVLSLHASHLLLATGRVPNTEGLNLAAVGIKTGPKGHIVVDDQLKTTAPGVYAIGDGHGGPAFTHMSYDDFRIIRSNFLPKSVSPTTPAMATTQVSRSRRLTPYVVYIDPQLGHVGLHAKDLEGSGRQVKTATMPMSSVARAIETAETRGLMKATVDAKTGEILGFTCLGIEGGEIMSIVQTAIMGGLKWWDLEAAVYAHPTLAESLNNLWKHFK